MICNALTTLDPYCSLTPEEQGQVLKSLRRFEHNAGDVMMAEFAWIDSVGFLAAGMAEVYMGLHTGTREKVYSIYPGGFFGDLACLTDRKSPVSVVCRDTAVVYYQPYEDFMRLLESNSVLKNYFLRSALNQLWHVFQMARSGGGLASISYLPDCRISEPLKKVVEFIGSHYDRRLTVGQAAEVAGMGKSTFSRWFKQALGVSFKTYLNQIRIANAKHLIGVKGLNVTEACFSVGFNDTAYFSRAFRKIEGISPSDYKSGR